jgi:putative Mg2+ transporter-C (MgtC) family protein
MTLLWEDIIKLIFAMALGGMIGFEREMRDKSAGFRTLMFISTGSALFTIYSIKTASLPGFEQISDPGRITAQIVTGIGFLGGGVIIRERGEIRGLTTASTIWLAAALGIGAGLGDFLFATLSAVLIFLALLVFPSLEGLVRTITRSSTYNIVTNGPVEKYDQLSKLIKSHRLHIVSSRQGKNESYYIFNFTVTGQPDNHNALVKELLADPDIIQLNE